VQNQGRVQERARESNFDTDVAELVAQGKKICQVAMRVYLFTQGGNAGRNKKRYVTGKLPERGEGTREPEPGGGKIPPGANKVKPSTRQKGKRKLPR